MTRQPPPPPSGTEPPQRLSSVRGHPWHDAYWIPRARVLVNGIEREAVIEASGPDRYALRRELPLRLLPDGTLATIRDEGDVVIAAKRVD